MSEREGMKKTLKCSNNKHIILSPLTELINFQLPRQISSSSYLLSIPEKKEFYLSLHLDRINKVSSNTNGRMINFQQKKCNKNIFDIFFN
jgi:hypothetical protein